METVTFQCGNCKNLMAVETGFLGQQVRCPHCQQVVLVPVLRPPSPAPAGPAPHGGEAQPAPPAVESNQPAPPMEAASDFSLPMPPQPEEESILAGSEGSSEALFGGDSSAPVLEMPAPADLPPIPAAPFSGSEEGEGIGSAVGPPDQAPTLVESAAEAGEAPPMHTSATDLLPPPDAPTEQDQTATYSALDGDGQKELELSMELPVESPGAELSRQVARRAKAESMVAAYLLIFLIPYAIFMTLVAGYYYWRMQQMPHPLERLQDLGDNPPAKRGTSSVIDIIPPETNLPSKLQVGLGQSIRIGDLEVMPKKVEQRRIIYCSENKNVQSQESEGDALVLTLQLRNVSEDVFFIPTDPFFERQWKEDSAGTKPYMFLEMGPQRFFGGPIRRSQRGRTMPREFIQGQENDNQVLKPQEERITVVSTDPGNRDILKILRHYKGPLVWRVQLRQGLVPVRNGEVSATAVIGVVFQDKDIIYQSRTATP